MVLEYEEEYNFGSGFNKSGVAKLPPVTYKEGPLPIITDSVFSLIILVTISLIICSVLLGVKILQVLIVHLQSVRDLR